MSSIRPSAPIGRVRLSGTSSSPESMFLDEPSAAGAAPAPLVAPSSFEYSIERYTDERGDYRAKSRFLELKDEGTTIRVRDFCGNYEDGPCEADLSHHKWEKLKGRHPPTPPPRSSPVFTFDFPLAGAAASRRGSEDEGVLDCASLVPVEEEAVLPYQFSLVQLPNESAEYLFTGGVVDRP